jgi:hypothetical protein
VNAAPDAIRGSLTPRLAGTAGTVLASGPVAVAAGRTRSVSLRVNRAGRWVLSSRARVAAEVTVTDPSDAPAAGRRVVLRAARAPAATVGPAFVRATPAGRVRFRVACRRGRAAGPCRGRLALRARNGVVAGTRIGIASGRSATVSLRLSAGARKRLRRSGRLLVRARTTTTIPVGLSTSRSSGLMLLAIRGTPVFTGRATWD